MNVNYPRNVDDELIKETGAEHDFPLTTPTSMTAFLYRVKHAGICREAVDSMPSMLLEPQEPDYSLVLALDRKLRALLAELPTFFQLDPISIHQSKQICQEQPNIIWQRIGIHFGIHSRLCRLHRPYHLEGSTNPKYAYSHTMCIRSAQTVLELRRAMDDVSTQVAYKPARFWVIMQHVFIAALILATDVSFNPNTPDAELRKSKVLAAYQSLERSEKESSALMEGIRKNMQTLMATLHKKQPQVPDHQAGEPCIILMPKKQPCEEPGPSFTVDQNERDGSLQHLQDGNSVSSIHVAESSDIFGDGGPDGDWDQLWSNFVAVAPDLDVTQWNSLLEDMDFTWQPDN